jgi:hypothetical protein
MSSEACLKTNFSLALFWNFPAVCCVKGADLLQTKAAHSEKKKSPVDVTTRSFVLLISSQSHPVAITTDDGDDSDFICEKRGEKLLHPSHTLSPFPSSVVMHNVNASLNEWKAMNEWTLHESVGGFTIANKRQEKQLREKICNNFSSTAHSIDYRMKDLHSLSLFGLLESQMMLKAHLDINQSRRFFVKICTRHVWFFLVKMMRESQEVREKASIGRFL